MTRDIFKDYIQAIRPYEPGKPIKEVERELGLRHLIKLASNENPLGPSGKALRAMRRAIREAHLYPESTAHYLVERLAVEHDVKTNQILVGNGSNEILELLARGFLSPGDEVVSSETSFLVYPILSQACGAKYVGVPMASGYRYDLEAMVQAITEKTRIVFIANPNNPTGTYVTTAELEAFLAKVPQNVIVCIDEAYINFVEAEDFPDALSYVEKSRPNLIVMRTFSKAYGLAGLRVGYAVANEQLISYLHKIRQPFNVNSIAQAAATAALDDRFFIWRTKHLVSRGRRFFYKHFKQLGLEYLPSQANFVLVKTGCDGNDVFQSLLKVGIIIRSMKAYGLDTWIRVTVGRRSQNSLFLRSLRECLKRTDPK
ncbi:MAG: histidinol-phosphate transaminase [Candidatus Omnitrophota bacterium]|nr:histidinol-phosphate transaminase [Candidatus Omnitrophota bacterium]